MSNTLTITHVPTTDLKPHGSNARTHSKKQVQQIADSIKQFGFVNPVLADAGNRLIAGHGRVAAAKLLGMETVPVVLVEGLTDDQMRAYIIADNRLAELAGWDDTILAIELQHLTDIKLDFDITLTGFELPAIDILIQSTKPPAPAQEELPPVNVGPVVTKLGDLWLLGQHKIICANAMEADSYTRLLGNEQAQMVFTDPPYNVAIPGHVSGKGKIQHEDFAMASGEMDQQQFTAFLRQFMELTAQHSQDGSLHYICMDWRHLQELLAAGGAVYTELKNLCVWNKTNAGMGSLYRSKHELIPVYKNGTAPHINNIELGKHGRNRTNVWDYDGQSGFSDTRQEDLSMHPTVKPTQLVADAILDASHRDGVIIDPFGGSGTTLLAAEQTGRKARLIELEPKYVDVTIRRWQQSTGKAAIHSATGQIFDQMISDGGQ